MMGMNAFCKLVCFYFGPPGLEVETLNEMLLVNKIVTRV
jgi:hypothetical protein